MTPWLADRRERPSSIVAPMATVGQQLQRRPAGPSGSPLNRWSFNAACLGDPLPPELDRRHRPHHRIRRRGGRGAAPAPTQIQELATAASRRRRRVGPIAGRSADQRCWVGAALVRASQWIKRRNAPPKPLVFQCRVFGEDPLPPELDRRHRPHHRIRRRGGRGAAPAPTQIQELATAASRRRRRVGPIAGRSADQRCWVGAALVRASQWIKRRNAPPKPLVFQCRVFGEDPLPPELDRRHRPHHRIRRRGGRGAAPAPTQIQELATAASRRRRRVGPIAGRSADQRCWVGAALVRASQWIKRRNAPPKPLVFQCRLLAMTPYLAARGRRPRPISGVRPEPSAAEAAPSSPRWRRRPAAAAPPRRPERVRSKPLVFQCRLLAMTPYTAVAPPGEPHPSAAFATSARAPSSPRWRRRPAAAAPPRRPERVAPLTDAAIAAAPNRIERKWNRRRRPCGGPSRSRCRPRARESSDKEEERATLNRWSFQCRLLAMTPYLAARGRRPHPSAAFATSARAPSSPRWRRRPAAAAPPRRPERVIVRPDRPSSIVAPNRNLRTTIREKEMATSASSRSAAQAAQPNCAGRSADRARRVGAGLTRARIGNEFG